MQELYDYKKFAVLYVDDEEKSLKYFTRAFSEKFRVFTAIDAQEGFKIFEEHKDEIAIFFTDQRMPGEKGVQLLERVRKIRPSVIRILVTAYTDAEVAIDAVNNGSIYKYVSKPWDIPELGVTLRRAVEFFLIQRERDHLLCEKLGALEKLVVVDRILGLGMMASGLRSELKNALTGLHAFLNARPLAPGLADRNLDELKSHSRWRQIYLHTKDHLKAVSDLVQQLPLEGKPAKNDLAKCVSQALEPRQQALVDERIDVDNELESGAISVEANGDLLQRVVDLALGIMLSDLPARSGLALAPLATGDDSGKVGIKLVRRGSQINHVPFQTVFDPFTVADAALESLGLDLVTLYLLVYHLGGTIRVDDEGEDSTVLELALPSEPIDGDENWEDALLDNLLNENVWELLTDK